MKLYKNIWAWLILAVWALTAYTGISSYIAGKDLLVTGYFGRLPGTIVLLPMLLFWTNVRDWLLSKSSSVTDRNIIITTLLIAIASGIGYLSMVELAVQSYIIKQVLLDLFITFTLASACQGPYYIGTKKSKCSCKAKSLN